jgi:iron-sulfur cluster assembly protein
VPRKPWHRQIVARGEPLIALTEAAAKEIRKIKTENGLAEDVPVRIGIKGGGCSGFTYTFDFDSHKSKFDLEFESQGMRVLVDKKSHLYIDGTEIDWSYSLMDRGLKFKNPSAKGSCGCGTSFIYEPKEQDQSLPNLQFT